MSKNKVLETLEKNPTGLSISEIAQESGLHRNTVSTVIKKLQAGGEIKLKKLGSARIYYLKKYSGLHKMESGYKGKNISVGLGVSDLQDGYKAGISAAKQAAMQSSKGATPSFSLVFVSSKYNSQIKEVVKGINTVLGNNWIGCTTDKELNSILGYSEGTIEVLCVDTKYLHFGIGISEDYRKNPVEEGKKATREAIENCPAERSKFATAQFMRGIKKRFVDIAKNPPYFILTLIGGIYYEKHKPVPSNEEVFLEGIKSIAGPYTSVVGASAAEDLEIASTKYEGKNYVFANGKYYDGGAVVCFIISELYFGANLEHGYKPTNIYGTITKVSGNGRIIEEINNKPALDEYCRLVGYKKEELLKNPIFFYSIHPMCSFNESGNIYPKIVTPVSPIRSESRMTGPLRSVNGSSFVIGQYDEKKAIESIKNAISELLTEHKDKKIVLAITFDCSVRRLLLREKVKYEMSNALKSIENGVLVGFYTMGEIGGKYNLPPRCNNATSTILCIFDKLQVE